MAVTLEFLKSLLLLLLLSDFLVERGESIVSQWLHFHKCCGYINNIFGFTQVILHEYN